MNDYLRFIFSLYCFQNFEEWKVSVDVFAINRQLHNYSLITIKNRFYLS